MICSDCKENDRSWSTSLHYRCNNEKCENCFDVKPVEHEIKYFPIFYIKKRIKKNLEKSL